jgi:serine/threonine protein kinase
MAAESPAEWMLAGIRPGSVVAGYRVESRIGFGGMAVVLRARDESLGRLVALKVLAPALADDAAFRERFIRESRAAAAVDHPHIIPVYAAGEAGGVLYIAMRYVPGGDLRGLLHREGPLPAGRAGYLLHQVASALDAGHDAGLVHRDVKPANILIDANPGRDDHPYLADFGLAKPTAATAGLTGTGQFLGTLEYCAPEQISGKRAVPQTDQYALGCVGYTMLTGTVPFPREEATAILWAHMSEAPPALTSLRRDLPPAVDDVIAKALAKAPEDRYATCGEFVDALRTACGTRAFPGFPGSGAQPGGTPWQPEQGVPTQSAGNSIPPGPVPPSPLSTPPRLATITQSNEFASPTEDVKILRPGDSAAQSDAPAADVTGAQRAVKAPQYRIGRRARIALAAAIVVAGSATALALTLISQPAKPEPGNSVALLARLADPVDTELAGVAFQSDDTVVTVDNADHGFSWNLTSSSPSPTDMGYSTASAVLNGAEQVSADDSLQVVSGSQLNIVDVQDTATGKVVAIAAMPAGTDVLSFALSADGTELAVADSNNSAYIWKIPR